MGEGAGEGDPRAGFGQCRLFSPGLFKSLSCAQWEGLPSLLRCPCGLGLWTLQRGSEPSPIHSLAPGVCREGDKEQTLLPAC